MPVINKATSSVKETVELARRFSLFAESMPLVYNLLLAERQSKLAEIGDEASFRVEEYRQLLRDWITRESAEQDLFKPSDLWDFLSQVRANLKHPTRPIH